MAAAFGGKLTMVRHISILCFVLLYSASPFQAHARKTFDRKKTPILLKADQLENEENLGLVIARGHVAASDGNQIVEADRMVYNRNLNTVTAVGNVHLYEQDGSIVKAHYVELSGDFKEIFIQKAYVLTADDEKIASNLIQKDGKKTNYTQAAYTPCDVCQDGTKTPLWKLQAQKVTYDQESENVYYRHATLKFKNFPIFYTPYLSHPGPRVKRRTGVLAPFIGSETKLGGIAGVPYYFNLAPNKDMTLTPVYTSRAGSLMKGEYRHRFQDAAFVMRGSITKTDSVGGPKGPKSKPAKRTHGHFLADAQADLNENWHFDGRFLQATNDSYLRRYYFLESDENYRRYNYLETYAHTEGFFDQNYVGIHGYRFQNLRADVDSKTVPDVFPVSEFSYYSPTMAADSYFHVTGNTLSIKRNRGAQVNRLSSTTAWVLPYTAEHGSVYEFKSFVRGDYYDIRKYQFATDREENGGLGRAIPGTSLSWQLPLVTHINDSRWIFEPIVKGVAKPHGYNNIKIPNEDSRDFEFDPRNLFLDDRFIGEDYVDDGQHVSYGMNVNAYKVYGVNMRFFLGQSYNFSKTEMFPEDSGVRKGASDYLGRFKLIPSNLGSIEWRFRANNKNGKLKKNLITLTAGPERFNVQVDYLYVDSVYFNDIFSKREQVSWRINGKLTDDWTGFVGARREFKYQPGPLEETVGAIYQDECFRFVIEGFRSHYQDRDMSPNTTILFTFGFKNLGDVKTGGLSAGGLA